MANKYENLLLADSSSFDWLIANDSHASQETIDLLIRYTLGVSERIDCSWLAAGPIYVASDGLGQPWR